MSTTRPSGTPTRGLNASGCRDRSHLVGIRSAAGGLVALHWIRVRDRFLAVLGVSRTVSGRAGNAGEISAAAAPLSSRYAIAGTGER